MAFKIFKKTKTPELIEYKKYIEYLKEEYLRSLVTENGIIYQNYRAMTGDKKERFLDEYAQIKIKKLVDLLTEKDEIILSIIKQDLLDSYTSDASRVEQLIEDLDYISKNSPSEQKKSANENEVKVSKDFCSPIPPRDEKEAMFMRLKANKPVVDNSVKYGLLSPDEFAEKSELLKKVILNMKDIIALMDFGAISEEEKQQLLFLANKIILSSGSVNHISDLNKIKELLELGTVKDWQIEELGLVLDKMLVTKRTEVEARLTTVINKIAEKNEKESDSETFDSGLGI